MRKKSLNVKEQNEKRLRVAFRILIISAVLVVIGSFIIGLNFLVKDLYLSFILDFIGSSFLFSAGLAFLLFFLYCIFVITFFNPQQLKRSSVIKFALGGGFTLIITVLLFNFTVTEAKNSIQDIKAYSNGDWQVKDLVVTDIYRGRRPSKIVLIETSEGQMTLHWENFLVYKGQKYRFTYLDTTNTIIEIEQITD